MAGAIIDKNRHQWHGPGWRVHPRACSLVTDSLRFSSSPVNATHHQRVRGVRRRFAFSGCQGSPGAAWLEGAVTSASPLLGLFRWGGRRRRNRSRREGSELGHRRHRPATTRRFETVRAAEDFDRRNVDLERARKGGGLWHRDAGRWQGRRMKFPSHSKG